MITQVRQFVSDRIIPLEAEFLARGFSGVVSKLDSLRQEAKAAGLWTPQLQLSLREYAGVSEELGRTPIGHYVCNCQAPDAGNMEVIKAHASPEQRREFLDPLMAGEVRSCFAMTEPEHAGSNPAWMSTTAVREGGNYVINGHKWFTSGADGAAFVLVMAVTNPQAVKPHQRASLILVPASTQGFRIVRNISVMGEPGSGWASHSEVMFENCRVPASNLLGQEGYGFAMAQERLGPGRIHHCMRWIGICERSFDLMCRNAAERELAPGKMLGTRQIVQEWIADSRAEIHAARLLVMDAADKIEQRGAAFAREEISIIKFYVAGVLQRVIDRAIQAYGAKGMTDDLLLAYWYRHERAARIYDGADEVHRSVVARSVLRRYGLEIEI